MGKKYHINGKGEPGVCRASVVCPFGDLQKDHFESPQQARAAFEGRAKNNLFPLTPLKKLTHRELVASVLQESAFTGSKLKKLKDCIELAEVLHEKQVRKALIQGRADTPYIEHPLRNTLRLIRAGVRDPSVLEANVLHDTVEDCSRRYVELYQDGAKLPVPEAREQLLSHIRTYYSAKTARLVTGVTNPYVPNKEHYKKTQEQKHRDYYDHVKEEVLSDPDVFLIKVSDFIDNAGSLHHATDEELPGAQRRADKYLPLIEVFREGFEHHRGKLAVDEEGLKSLKHMIDKTERRLKQVLAKEAA